MALLTSVVIDAASTTGQIDVSPGSVINLVFSSPIMAGAGVMQLRESTTTKQTIIIPSGVTSGHYVLKHLRIPSNVDNINFACGVSDVIAATAWT